MIAVLKIIQVFLLASVKYVFTFPFAMLIGLNFLQTLIAVTLGGIAGFFAAPILLGALVAAYRVYQEQIHPELAAQADLYLKNLTKSCRD